MNAIALLADGLQTALVGLVGVILGGAITGGFTGWSAGRNKWRFGARRA